MSAIFGIFYRDGRPVNPEELARMRAVLAHRGPDGAGVWHDGPAGLGHLMLRTTPESLNEHLPLLSRDGRLALTADARIDNRDELIAELNLRDRPATQIADSALILAAYERWGERCVEHLLGDFAFAVWDRREQKLFCARDHMGVKPFYYYCADRVFAFASEIKGLLALPQVPRRLNEVRIGDYLAGLDDDLVGTFYQEILRLPPAHTLTVTSNADRLLRYWALDPAHELRLASDEAYTEQFRAIFSTAIQCRLRSNGPIGSLLSGGLDSSSITGVARLLLAHRGGEYLHTFSAVFDAVPECDERSYIQQVLNQGGLQAHYVPGDQIGPLSNLEQMLWHNDEPFFAPGLYLNYLLYRASVSCGVRVLLDGHDGDGVVSHGFGYLTELARSGRLVSLARELYGSAQTFGESFWELLWGYSWKFYLQPIMVRSRFIVPFNYARNLIHRAGTTGRAGESSFLLWQKLLNADFVKRTGLDQRWADRQARMRTTPQTERAQHHAELMNGIKVSALEVLDKAAGAFALDLRHPFWDRRVVEFCLALPPEQKLQRGWGRLILRRAMSVALPQAIAWRRTKNNFFPNLTRGLLAFDRDRFDALFDPERRAVADYLDLPALRPVYDQLVRQPSQVRPREVFMLWGTAALSNWLHTGDACGSPITSTVPSQRHTVVIASHV